MTKGTRVTVPEFEIFSNPTINISQVKQRRFTIIDRTNPYEAVEKEIRTLCKEKELYSLLRIYIATYIKDNKHIPHLRKAIAAHCPEHEELIDKLLVLK